MITLVPYDPNWKNLFEKEKILLQQALTTQIVDIQHIGSTAIPGIYAKPVVDILIGVSDLSQFQNPEIKKIQSLGYEYISAYEKGLPFRRFFQKNNEDGQRQYQIHLVNYHSSWWHRHILFRDFLREYPLHAQEYESHKLKLSTQFDDSNEYAMAKNEFCRMIDKFAYFNFAINQPFLTSERLNAYIPQLACFDEYRHMVEDPTFIQCYGVSVSADMLEERLSSDIMHWDQHGFGPCLWFDKQNQEFVGRVGLKTTLIENQFQVELAYAITTKHWGQGLTVEMSRIIIEYAFKTLNLSEIICFTLVKNHQSLSVMKKLSFQYEKNFIYKDLPHVLYRLKK